MPFSLACQVIIIIFITTPGSIHDDKAAVSGICACSYLVLRKGALSGPVQWREAFPMAKPGDVGFARFRHLRRGFVRRDRGGRGAAHPAAGAARSGAARQAQGLVWWRHLVDLGKFFVSSRPPHRFKTVIPLGSQSPKI